VRALVADSSVVVKWFKKGEEFEGEALGLRRDVLSSTVILFTPEIVPLEVCRALMKVGYPSEKAKEAYATLSEMGELGFLAFASTAVLKDIARDQIVGLNLYVADALSLAAAISNSTDLLTEDRHLLRQGVKENLERRKLKVVRLGELYPKSNN